MSDRRRLLPFNKHLLHRPHIFAKDRDHLDVALLELLRDDLSRRQSREGVEQLELGPQSRRVGEALRQDTRESFFKFSDRRPKFIKRVVEFFRLGI